MKKIEDLKHELLLNDAYAFDIIKKAYEKLIEGKINNDDFAKKISTTMLSYDKARQSIIAQSFLSEIDKEFGISELRKEILGE